MAVYAYIRVSTDKQEHSPKAQRDAIVAAAKHLGLDLTRSVMVDGKSHSCWFMDDVTSQIKWNKRPEGKKLVSILREGDTVIVSKFDRMFRSVSEWCHWRKIFEKRGVKVIFLSFSTMQIDWKNPLSMMVLTVLAAVAEYEREMCAVRTSEGLQAKRSRGERVTKDPGAGFCWVVTGYTKSGKPICEKRVNPADSQVCDQILEWFEGTDDTEPTNAQDIYRHLVRNRIKRVTYKRRKREDGSIYHDELGRVVDDQVASDWSPWSIRNAIKHAKLAREKGGWDQLLKDLPPTEQRREASIESS